MLAAVKDGRVKSTWIMYESNLSWKPCRPMLTNLVDQGLLREQMTGDIRSKTIFEITEKGLAVLEHFKGAEGLINLSIIAT